MHPTALPPHEVLDAYPLLKHTACRPLGNHGGFSGARLWRFESSSGAFCLRAWPPGDPAPERLRWIHEHMRGARAAGLSLVPAVLPTSAGLTWLAHAGRLWELTEWLPGRANYHGRPSAARLEAACVALARLHAAWCTRPTTGPCPGVIRRLDRARAWADLLASGWKPAFVAGDPVSPLARRVWDFLRRTREFVPLALQGWHEQVVPLQVCLCDVWHDHVLFEGDAVSGLIDYGALKVDHVAVDLARLLGSLVGDDPVQRAIGMHAYTRLRSLDAREQVLVPVLDETGTWVALATWLRWLYVEGRSFEDRHAVAARLESALRRVEAWTK